MELEKQLSHEEHQQLAQLLWRYATYNLDQYDHLKFNTKHGEVFVTVSRSSAGYDNTFTDINHLIKQD